MKTKILLSVLCGILAISNIVTYVSFQKDEQAVKNPSDYTNFNVYESEFEGTPYLIFVQDGKVVGVVHDPKDYME
mgnify:FL=1